MRFDVKRCVSSWLLSLLLLPLAAQAGAGARVLDGFMQGLKTLRADFSQTLRDEQGDVLETASGRMALERPGRFRWDYLRPYEQSIIADGKRIWVYDKDLEQVTVKPQARTLASSPAMLLGGEARIRDQFEVTDLGSQDGLDWVRLQPRGRDEQYTGIELGFAGVTLRRMRLADNFGQTTLIEFSHEQRNPELDADLFRFQPPAGVDVIDGSVQ